MSRKDDRHQELLEAARTLAIELKYVEEDHNGQLVDLGAVSIEDEDDDGDEGMEPAREEIQALMDQESELVEDFEEDLDLAIEYISKVIERAQSA